LSARPAYFSTKVQVSRGYAKQYGDLGRITSFITSRELRLIDVRYMSVILSRVLRAMPDALPEHVQGFIAGVTMAFGLCSFRHQVDLVDRIYGPNNGPIAQLAALRAHLKSPDDPSVRWIEQRGVRIAESENDAGVILFLRSMFHGIDGYIAPRLNSPFHIEVPEQRTPAEIVLFRTGDCGLK
jgi:hypothetical protein